MLILKLRIWIFNLDLNKIGFCVNVNFIYTTNANVVRLSSKDRYHSYLELPIFDKNHHNMTTIGTKISDIRKSKGLTQEQLAELSKINLRTIQRIENNENEPRGTTLQLICDALEINSEILLDKSEKSKSRAIGSLIINGIFLILLNLLLMSVIGFLTLDSNANLN